MALIINESEQKRILAMYNLLKESTPTAPSFSVNNGMIQYNGKNYKVKVDAGFVGWLGLNIEKLVRQPNGDYLMQYTSTVKNGASTIKSQQMVDIENQLKKNPREARTVGSDGENKREIKIVQV